MYIGLLFSELVVRIFVVLIDFCVLFLVMTDAIRKMVMEHKESGLIQEQAVKDGMFTLYHDGLAKAAKGLTTLDEVLRITTEG